MNIHHRTSNVLIISMVERMTVIYRPYSPPVLSEIAYYGHNPIGDHMDLSIHEDNGSWSADLAQNLTDGLSIRYKS